jgi:hypothetical protein
MTATSAFRFYNSQICSLQLLHIHLSLLIDIVGVISPVDHKYKITNFVRDIMPEFNNNMEGFSVPSHRITYVS